MTTCAICETTNPTWAWTDTHGIAQCTTCGAPYKLYHYEGQGADSKRVDKAPECMVLAHWIPLLKRYRNETKRLIPGGFSFSGGYELAQKEDFDAYTDWCDAHRAEIDGIKSALENADA